MIICITAFLMFFPLGKILFMKGTLTILPLAFLLGVIAIIIEPYRIERIKTYFNLILNGEVADPRGTGYQMQQILIGIGSGGCLVKGLVNQDNDFGYLVENTAFTDSTFAVLLEEMGLLGGAAIIIA